jgi:hypothetical protein
VSFLVHAQLFAYKFWMAGDADDEVSMLIVCLYELRDNLFDT